MIHAYDKLYLEKARLTLAGMIDYAVNSLKYNISVFFDLFIASGVAEQFESGDASTIAGSSGPELVFKILDTCKIPYKQAKQKCTRARSREYWTGWALAYYQWESALSFESIIQAVPIEDIHGMYDPYHEMDIRHFVDEMNIIINISHPDSNLKRLRTYAGLSQSQLALASGVPVRTIQQYEQRQKNINKAGADYIFMLANALGCNPMGILEMDVMEK